MDIPDIDVDIDCPEVDSSIELTEFDTDLEFTDYDPIADANEVWDSYDPFVEAEALRINALVDQIELELAEVVNNPDYFLSLTNQLDTLRR